MAAKRQVFPFHGKLSAVDKTAKTMTLEGKEKARTLHITSQTRLTKDDKPATLDDAAVGEIIAGQARLNEAGQTEAVSVRIGAKTEGPQKPKQEKKARAEK